ncbi:hypothetical protein AMATHDRAFT_43951 [Amanita thiersii Skay4041]|uniref:Protein kinase domain-containing protein n=1 Tax=Amanita thiersii Skay4041 TaxID=703135 RepID=A0A2A9NDJ3_9AGAR|nr:hypothetical protein AMATHDRAFT_43951 [Amanita thiersii Skay4041]
MTDTIYAPPVVPLPEGVQDLTGQVHFDYGRNIIGQGGMSDVIRGELNGYIVAVKIIRYIDPDQIAAYQRRADRELTVWRGLNHPNILRLIGVVNWNNYNTRPGLVSIIVPGKVLSYVRNRRLADKHAILIGMAHGLNYLHSQGVIHGDLKPPNVLVDECGIPKICDFGLSRILDSDEFITRTTHRGTIPYIAPEILRTVEESDKVNPLELNTLQSDMYAFGLTAGAVGVILVIPLFHAFLM